MNDLDQKIQAALRHDRTDDTLTGEPNLAEELISAFRGRYRWFSILMIVVNIVLFAGAVWSTVRFLDAGSVQAQIQWSALTIILLSAAAFIKLWFWLEMHTNRVMREVKRVELLLLTRLPADQPKKVTARE